MTVFERAGKRVLPLVMAAVTAISAAGIPVYAESAKQPYADADMAQEMDAGSTQDKGNKTAQTVQMDENRKIISLSEVIDELKVTVSADPGVIPDGSQLRVTRIEGVEALS